MNVNISSYMNNSSRNYGMNSILCRIGDLDLYFSYNTVVAFRTPETGLVISDNMWGPTTGKHLNAISRDHTKRINREKFEQQLMNVLHSYKLDRSNIPNVNM